MEMELNKDDGNRVTEKRKRGKLKKRFLDVVKENMGKLVQRRQMLKTERFGE